MTALPIFDSCSTTVPPLHPADLPRPPLAAAGPLAVLRAATHDRHERIDALMNLGRMREPGRYPRVLQAFDAFLAGWEPAVAAALPERFEPWLQARSRRPFLQSDLRALGLPSAQPVVPPVLASAGAAWGSVYVMEGSALGGRVIARTLADMGLDAEHGAAYFHGWGDATGAMWREARERLASELAEPGALVQACEGACATFDTLSTLFERALDERTAAA
jgi:heme oxygenase